MNNDQLRSILGKGIEYESFEHNFKLNNCTSFLEESTSQDLCFYDLKEGASAYELLIERLERIQLGVLAINRKPDNKLKVPYFVVRDGHWMESQKKICDNLYPLDWNSKKFIGVTGTNGKTTTVYLALQVLNQIGRRGFSIGSLGVRDISKKLQGLRGMTTPPYLEIRKILFQYFKDYDFCVMEISSHALAQQRIYKILYDVVGWTNFGQDHLDYHHSLDDYFQQKLKLPKYHMKKNKNIFISNKEQELAQKLSEVPIKFTQEIECWEKVKKRDFLNISFNRENLKLAISLIAEVLGHKIEIDIGELASPPGRFEILQIGNKMAIVDSAHTPDAMEGILRAIREAFPDHQLITIFGCGGDRDHFKRPLMGKIAEKNSDITIVTSDNPRHENAEEIIKDIVSGMDKCDYCEEDRSMAIALGVSLLRDRSLLAILGKGAETYQIIGNTIKDFSDVDQFHQHIKELK